MNDETDTTLDNESYEAGRAAFRAGASLRAIFEACMAADTNVSELKALSGAIGFADALIDALRAKG